ncbi:tyrosine-type recombinase/integrase [Oceanibacterium hippocampi]|uniref:Putative prophage CPS-53 integrase n=1 Tax=Oceanibacterium hippocampi TaxID=745714 RepID=A0A1Y5TZ78_9PROT|nr:site-specific integrase [Oceanibacterium hippocampi]SLN77385.1 Putative prophage CPS-53 integrase [Oceanibacterium hippocampi]
MPHLTKELIERLPPPAKGYRLTYDDDATTPGFGIRVTATGVRSFILTYRTKTGRQSRATIGRFGPAPLLSVAAARREARDMLAAIRGGADPVVDARKARDEATQKRAEERGAKTVADLCDDYVENHLPDKRPASAEDDRRMIRDHIKPHLGNMKARDIRKDDINRLLRKIRDDGKPVRANRVRSLLSTIFNREVGESVDHNPVKGAIKNREEGRKRYVTREELPRLLAAIAAHRNKTAGAILRLLLYTGARKGETCAAKWSDFDLDAGLWIKPGSTTKQKTEHRANLPPGAVAMLRGLPRVSEYVFPSPRRPGQPFRELKKPWAEICEAAEIEDLRIHDLRHTVASLLADAGYGLGDIGAILGHASQATTERYRHIFKERERAAADSVGSIIDSAAGKPSLTLIDGGA